MGEDCPHCVFEKTEANCPGCFEGSHYRPKPITNYDRIRAMSDEELAKTMHSTGDCPLRECPYAYADLSENGGNITDKQCVECWLDWLKEEAKA